jgi:intein-encoded DNA endonuclease-like protein
LREADSTFGGPLYGLNITFGDLSLPDSFKCNIQACQWGTHLMRDNGKKRKRWTQEELSTLRELYSKGMKKELAEKLGRSWKGIHHKALELNMLTPIGSKRLAIRMPAKKELEKLYKNSGIKRTAKTLGVNRVTVWRRVKKFGIELNTPVKNLNLNPSAELAYILGVLKGDGYVRYDTKKQYKYFVELRVTSEEFAKSFACYLQKIGLTPALRRYNPSIGSWGRNPIYSAKAYSKKFVEWYKKLGLEEIRKIVGKNREFAAAFVRGFYESEGSYYVSKKGFPVIYISNTDLSLLLLVKDFVSSLGYHLNLNKKASLTSGGKRAYCLQKKSKSVSELIAVIKPCIKSEPSNIQRVNWRMAQCQQSP